MVPTLKQTGTVCSVGVSDPPTPPPKGSSPLMDSNGSCRDVVRYFARLLSCARWGVQVIPDRSIKAVVSVLITPQEWVPSVPLPGSSHVH